MSASQYIAYPNFIVSHYDKSFAFDFNMAFCDDWFRQVTQWTYNRMFLIEAMRVLKLGLPSNPYATTTGTRPPIGSFSMFENVVRPAYIDSFTVVFRTHGQSQQDYMFNMKRALHYLRIFEDELGFFQTEFRLYIDTLNNLMFFQSDIEWTKHPFLLDLYFHVINMGEDAIVGDTVASILHHLTYGVKNQNKSHTLLGNYAAHIVEMVYNHQIVFGEKEFWNRDHTTRMYTDTYNLHNLLNGNLAKHFRDDGALQKMQHLIAMEGAPF
jgi:hypothetical protein